MPPPKIPPPEFSPYGRYGLDVRERKVEGPTYFHDTECLQDECQFATVPENFKARFNNPAWAVHRGYTHCQYCLTNA